ncbi:STAS/SEC14 domain-containing protein [Joostella atrarenae]|uniref:STAS/SEC14 domain-containing protein n=1 Tax=Joostella atrarenae TaxID=679257 RepID=A0ABS9IZH2_9FLAO|nr:STAS/SEC14 domain-containing protein [Joostella atrarenae]MCF8713575.1 STAS/SEC14 domain-containing protein [Joostella atrarenae]
MISQLKSFENNVLAIEVFDGFTKEDEKICQKLFEDKLKRGFTKINVLVKLDEMRISKSSTKAFFQDILWSLRNYKKMGHLAIVAHSNIVKALVPIDNVFFQRASEGRYERYFDISQMEEAMMFVNSTV